MPNILVTNDDGIHAPGLRALVEGLKDFAEITVVAPTRERSEIRRPNPNLSVEEIATASSGRRGSRRRAKFSCRS